MAMVTGRVLTCLTNGQAIERGETEEMWNRGLLDAAMEGNNIKLREFMAKGADVDCIDTRVEWAEHGRCLRLRLRLNIWWLHWIVHACCALRRRRS